MVVNNKTNKERKLVKQRNALERLKITLNKKLINTINCEPTENGIRHSIDEVLSAINRTLNK